MNKRNISVSKGLENPLLFINSDMKKSICGISILLTVGLGFGNNVKIKVVERTNVKKTISFFILVLTNFFNFIFLYLFFRT